MQSKLNWSDVAVLLAFGRAGSLSAAAAELKIDETTAARRLKRLERTLGSQLLARDGAKFRLTPAGSVAIERAQAMERAAAQLMGGNAAGQAEVYGRVVVTSLLYVFNSIVVPALPALAKAHPKIVLTFLADNRNFSLTNFEADIAIRMGTGQTQMLASRKLCDVGFAVYRPRNRFRSMPLKQCLWIGPDERYADLPESRWLIDHIPQERFVMRSNSTATNLTAVKAGFACAVLPALLGDQHKDITRLQERVLLNRELWLVTRPETPPGSAVGVTAKWIATLFEDLAPRLAG